MKIIYFLFLAMGFIACSGTGSHENRILNADTPQEDLLQTLKNSYLNSGYDISTLQGYKINKHKEEIAKTIKIADTFHIKGYGQTLVLYSYSIGSDILRESVNYKKENGKWYKTFLYSSSYDDDPFKDGNSTRAKEILEKEEKWIEESEETKSMVLGTIF